MTPKGFIKKDQPPQPPRQDAGLLQSWSYSQYSDYEACPAKVKYNKIDRVPQIQGDALARGIAIHANCEQALLTGNTDHLDTPTPGKPTMVVHWKEHFIDLIDNHALSEMPITLTRDWSITEWRASNAWMRAKVDAIVVDPNDRTSAVIIDFKSGRPYPDHVYQADLYATAAFALPQAYETVSVQMWYIDNKPDAKNAVTDFNNRVWRRTEQPVYISGWEHRIEPMMNDTIFPHRPGKHCNWCGFSGKKSGPCPKG